jgi:hypothetical protein
VNAFQQWANRVDWPGLERALARAADPSVLSLAAAAGLVLGALVVSFLAIARTTQMGRAARGRIQAMEEKLAAALEESRTRSEALAAQLEEVRQSASQIPASPRAGFNLNKRSQALRMYRRGDPPGRIASALEISPQEVDLLLKVHRIVIKNL